MTGEMLFEKLAQLMKENPPYAADKDMVEKLNRKSNRARISTPASSIPRSNPTHLLPSAVDRNTVPNGVL
jgi:hypothetical protein